MGITNFIVPITTNTSGDATAYTQGPVTGLVEHIRYLPDATSPMDTGADVTITGEHSGISVLTKSNIGTAAFTVAPRQPTHLNSDGSAALYAAGGTGVLAQIAFAGERIKVVIAQGGNTLSGSFEIVVSRDD